MDFAFSYIGLIIIVFVVVATLYFHFFAFGASTAQQAPAILTSVGIFGTFIGVALGLQHFDTTNIEASVPELLLGLKTAFWSSIAGLAGALTVKFRYAIRVIQRNHRAGPATAANFDTLAALLERIEVNMQPQRQLEWQRQMQSSVTEGLAEVSRAMTQYQERMAAANSKALVEALNQVMKDFNTVIDEQYGENFKQLRQSVTQMTLWQEENRQQIMELIIKHQRAAEAMDTATTAYERLMHQTGSFSKMAEGMDELLGGLNEQSENLGQYLETMGKMVVKAQEGLPNLEKRVLNLTENLDGAIRENSRAMAQLLRESSQVFKETFVSVSSDLEQTLRSANSGTLRQINRLLEETDKRTEKLEAQLEEELNKSLHTLGVQLSALSEKFVSDYTPLTHRLRELLELAERAGRSNA